MRLPWHVVCLSALFACTGADKDVSGTLTDGTVEGDADTDTDADSDADTDPTTSTTTTPTAQDTDGDGLTDDEEAALGTNPTKPDTDGDGLTDGAEVQQYGTDPLSSDTDRDGETDDDEIALGLDPLNPDSDSDGLADGAEFDTGTDALNPDSDGDGLLDGDEVAAGTDPALPDTDGDGLLDGAEPGLGLDPANADTDGDGLDDGAEPALGLDPANPDSDFDGLDDGGELDAGSDALNQDTDGDGLLDGAEVNQFGSDPTLVDSDGDNFDDPDEVVAGTDPALADTDNDGLNDPQEIFQSATDPLDADTDGGGARDGQEVLVDGTNPLDPNDDIGCAYPDLAWSSAPAPASGTLVPATVGVRMRGNWDFFAFRDATVAGVDAPAVAEFVLYDAAGAVQCTVSVDLESAVPAVGWTTDGGVLSQGFTLDLSNADSDCDGLDLATYGTTDVRDILDDFAWGVGIGELSTIELDLRAEKTAAGENWNADWAPYVNGLYVTQDGIDATEQGYVFGSFADCAVADLALPSAALGAGLPLVDDYYEGTDFLQIPWSDLSGVAQCLYPQADLVDTGWVPPAPTITPVYVAVYTQGLMQNSGTLYADFTDPSVPVDYSAGVFFDMYDAGFVRLCGLAYDASAATPVDVATLTPIDPFTGAVGGSLFGAFELTPTNGYSDCNRVSAATFGSQDIRDTIESITWTVGFGPTSALGAYVAGVGVPGNLVHSQYVSFDQTNAYEVNLGGAFPIVSCPSVDVTAFLPAPAGAPLPDGGYFALAPVIVFNL